MDDEGDDDEAVAEGEKSVAQLMREYTEKVTANMGDDGDPSAKSPVAKSRKMGDGTTANIARGGEEGKGGTGASAKDMSTGNVNTKNPKGASKLNKVSGGAAKKGDGAKSMFS